MAAQVRVGDIGTRFTATIVDENGAVVDVSVATLTMTFKRPNGTTFTKTPSLVNTGTDGQIRYVTTSASDIDMAGSWEIQGLVVIGSLTLRSDIHTVTVGPNL